MSGGPLLTCGRRRLSGRVDRLRASGTGAEIGVPDVKFVPLDCSFRTHQTQTIGNNLQKKPIMSVSSRQTCKIRHHVLQLVVIGPVVASHKRRDQRSDRALKSRYAHWHTRHAESGGGSPI